VNSDPLRNAEAIKLPTLHAFKLDWTTPVTENTAFIQLNNIKLNTAKDKIKIFLSY